VFADTLRSIAVIVASCLAYTFNDISPIHADAVAALVVSFLILLSLIPLFQGLVHTFSELKFAEAELEAQQELKIAAYQHDEQREHDEGNGVV
jgi:Co/Zn/Cd efflux system component